MIMLNDNSEFHTEEDHWKISVFNDDTCNEGTQDDLVEKGGDNEKLENEEGEMIDQEVRDIEPIVTRSGRAVRRPAYLENYALSAMSYSEDVLMSYGDIEDRSDRMEWRKAIKEELEALVENKTWEILVVNLPEEKKPLDCRWVFTIKRERERDIKPD
jgi:hypothetical protein